MKKMYIVLFVFFIILSKTTNAQVVINEIYGGGGNSGSTYKNDFIELYNNSNVAVSLTGWSVQYASAAGTTWAATLLTGSIPAKGYYLIQQAIGSGGTTALPTPDVIGNIAMSGTAGKVILCNTTALQAGANPIGTQIIDKVGFGTTANGFEGTGPAPYPSSAVNDIQRNPQGTDTDNNNSDFAANTPSPTNGTSGTDVTPPVINAFLPTTNATNIATNTLLTLTFSETIVPAAGWLKINNSTIGSFEYVDALSNNVTVLGNVVTISGINLQPASNYFITIPDSVFKDLAGNKYAGIVDNTIWNFSTANIASITINGIVNKTYTFNTCDATFSSDGFTQYSAIGALTWACTNFGRDAANPPKGNAPSGLQMNGYSNITQSNVLNEDWLISPKFNLTGITYPLLSFYSRTKFNGAPLQLKVSTNYPGYGDPRNFTWTDINGRFPSQISDSWTLSSSVDLSVFNQSEKVYIAFVYTSTNDEGARWTLDDFTLTNAAVAPNTTLDVSTTDILFTYTAANTTSTKSFIVTGYNLTSDLTINASAGFSLSTDNNNFSTTLLLPQASANNVATTIYARYQPLINDRNETGTITISAAGVANSIIDLKGSSTDPIKTLEVANWNIEWFGSIENGLGPVNKNLQEQNVKTILQNINADIYGLVEVVDTARLGRMVRQLPGEYAFIACNYGSHVNPPDASGGPLAAAQKEAFVYKKSMFSNVTTRPLINNQNITSASYNNWASGRYPFLMTADVTLNGVTKTINFVLLHAKANTSPTLTSYNRRQAAATELHDTLTTFFANSNVIVLGDLNDDLDFTITDGITSKITSYSAFTNDVNFFSPTLALSLAGKKSTVKYSDVIDHVILSNRMKASYINTSASMLTDVTSAIPNYGTTTTDHYPVLTRYIFEATAPLPIRLISFNAIKQNKTVKLSWQTSEETNSKAFIVQRSSNGINFTNIGTVSTSGVPNSYLLTDEKPLVGNNYYRLKLIDVDGKFDYSKTVKVLFAKNLVFSITPNPASTFINIAIENINQSSLLQIIDVNGKIVKQQIAQGIANITIPLTGLTKGLYTIKFIGSAQVGAYKLVVQ